MAMVSIDGEHVVTDNSTDEESEEDEDSDSEAVHENTNKTFKPFRDTKDKSTTRGTCWVHFYSIVCSHRVNIRARDLSCQFLVFLRVGEVVFSYGDWS